MAWHMLSTIPTKSSINCMCTNVLMQPVCSSNLVNINQVRHKNSCSSRATMKQYRLLYCTAHVSTIHSTLLSPSSISLHVHVLTQPCCDKTSIKLSYEILCLPINKLLKFVTIVLYIYDYQDG